MATTSTGTDYTPELFSTLCSFIATGDSLKRACERPGMPSSSVIYNWFRVHPETVALYAQAKEDSGDADQDKLDQIAERVLDGELDPQAARVAADIIKWSASKKKPKKYGDIHRYQHDIAAVKVEHGITISTQSLLGNIGQEPIEPAKELIEGSTPGDTPKQAE